jgi:hypothetical protein
MTFIPEHIGKLILEKTIEVLFERDFLRPQKKFTLNIRPNQVLRHTISLAESLVHYPPEVLVALSDNAAVIAHMLKPLVSSQLCDICCCQRILKSSLIPAMRIEDERFLLQSNAILLVPQAIFNLPKQSKIVLVDDYLFSGMSAHTLDTELRRRGFQDIRYVALVKIHCDRQETITPQAVGLETDKTNVLFPWEKKK